MLTTGGGFVAIEKYLHITILWYNIDTATSVLYLTHTITNANIDLMQSTSLDIQDYQIYDVYINELIMQFTFNAKGSAG